jgi:hypothetical protein
VTFIALAIANLIITFGSPGWSSAPIVACGYGLSSAGAHMGPMRACVDAHNKVFDVPTGRRYQSTFVTLGVGSHTENWAFEERP